jgi:para-nitrobenzyl esterase
MRSILISILILATVAAALVQHGVDAARAQAEQHLFVTTAEGQVYGAVQAGVASFKGIPYAAPPIGDLRWRPPQPAASRSEILLASDYGPPCLQPSMPAHVPAKWDPVRRQGHAPTQESTALPGDIGSLSEPISPGSAVDVPKLETASEDCLTINIFRPFEIENPLPVMVWFHGGSFADGAGGDPLTDGSRLAGEGVVVVTFNYRLGPLGWLAHPPLSHETVDLDANFGMMDQIAALRWVAENIGVFGGDAGNVTLFGDAAGGASVAMLMVSEAAAGLFQKAIIQSGKLREPARSLAEAEAIGHEFFRILGVEEHSSRLREVSSEQLLSAETTLLDDRFVGFSHTLDGNMVKESIAMAFKAGHEKHIPLIVGTNEDETVRLPEVTRRSNIELNIDLALANETMDLLKQLYPEAGSDQRKLATRLFTDRNFVEPARLIARAHSSRDASTYRYSFSYRLQGSPRGKATSGPEVEFVFGTLGTETTGLFTYKDRETSNVMRAYWENFARTGDPNGPGLPVWPRYSADEQILSISNGGIFANRDPWTARLDRLEQQSESR